MENDALIVLNYNRTVLISKIIKNISSFKDMPHLFIVDNNSDEKNLYDLKKIEKDNQSERIHFIYNNVNLGYAKGNNVALNKIEEYMDCKHVFIMNPDIILKDGILERIDEFLDETKNVGAVSIAHLDDRLEFSEMQGWMIPDYSIELKKSFILGRKSYYKKQPIKFDKEVNKIDAIAGSFFGLNYNTFKELGFFDPNTFLYYEENILGFKIKKAHLQSYILNYEINPIHNHKESSTSKIKFRINWKYYNDSRKYYSERYLKIKGFKKFILNLSIIFSRIEGFFMSLFK